MCQSCVLSSHFCRVLNACERRTWRWSRNNRACAKDRRGEQTEACAGSDLSERTTDRPSSSSQVILHPVKSIESNFQLEKISSSLYYKALHVTELHQAHVLLTWNTYLKLLISISNWEKWKLWCTFTIVSLDWTFTFRVWFGKDAPRCPRVKLSLSFWHIFRALVFHDEFYHYWCSETMKAVCGVKKSLCSCFSVP